MLRNRDSDVLDQRVTRAMDSARGSRQWCARIVVLPLHVVENRCLAGRDDYCECPVRCVALTAATALQVNITARLTCWRNGQSGYAGQIYTARSCILLSVLLCFGLTHTISCRRLTFSAPTSVDSSEWNYSAAWWDVGVVAPSKGRRLFVVAALCPAHTA